MKKPSLALTKVLNRDPAILVTQNCGLPNQIPTSEELLSTLGSRDGLDPLPISLSLSLQSVSLFHQ